MPCNSGSLLMNLALGLRSGHYKQKEVCQMLFHPRRREVPAPRP